MNYTYSIEDITRELGVSKVVVYQLIDAGALAVKKIQGVWLADEESVDRYRHSLLFPDDSE